MTGTIRLKLYKVIVASLSQVRLRLYDRGLATYDAGDTFDHGAAEGFSKIWGLPVETAAKHERRRAAKAPTVSPHRWRTKRGELWSGRFRTSPIPSHSNSGRHSDSIAVSSKTT